MKLWTQLVAGLGALALTACAGVDVQGVVRDAETDDPISGATVRIGEEETTTDRQGYYDFRVDSQKEAQRVAVSAPGYDTHTELTTIRDEPDEIVMDFQLDGQRQRAAQQRPADIEVQIQRPREERGGGSSSQEYENR